MSAGPSSRVKLLLSVLLAAAIFAFLLRRAALGAEAAPAVPADPRAPSV